MTDDSIGQRDRLGEAAELFVARFRAGERPRIEEFVSRYPQLADELRELLPALVMLEQHGSVGDDLTLAGKRAKDARLTPSEIGEFTIVREIARGGMGIVYEAVQQSLGRHVALKVLSSGSLLNPTHLERFRLEARSAGWLHHSHIVPVFGVGESDGIHYYAMQFIAGQSLDQVIEALRKLRPARDEDVATPRVTDSLTDSIIGELLAGQSHRESAVARDDVGSRDATATATHQATRATPGQAAVKRDFTGQFSSGSSGRPFYESVARVGLQVAEALAYAHGEGILHRDIKPSNLILDAKGNTWVTDFGLVKADDTQSLTDTGDFVGTLRYMAPERFDGWSDRRSDIYGLGATLYELLTLRTFFGTASRGQLIDCICHKQPDAPTKIDPAVPRDLETIVLKALAKEPGARYHTADEMAEDLRRFLADQPILARRSTARERFVRWCRRNPAVASLTATAALTLIAGILVSTWQAILATAAARDAETARQAEVVQRAEAERQRQQADLNAKKAQVEARKSQEVARFLKDMLTASLPAEAGGHDTKLLRELLDRAAERIGVELDEQPEVAADVRMTMGWIYHLLEQHEQSEAMYHEALRLERQYLKRDDPLVISTLGLLGFVLLRQEKLVEAEAVYREVLAMFADPSSPELHFSMNGLAGVLEKQGKLAEAEAMFVEVVAMRRQLLGEDSHMVGNALSNLAIIKGKRGRLDDAVALQRQALATMASSENPDKATILADFGGALERQGKFGEAEAVLRQALDMERRMFGEVHTFIAGALAALSRALEGQGKHVEAEAAYREALAVQRGVMEAAPQCAVATGALAWMLVTCPFESLREPNSAVALAKQATERSPRSSLAWRALGIGYYRTSRWSQALVTLDRSMELRAGGDPTEWLFAAMAHSQLGHQDEARTWYQRSIDWMESNHSSDEELLRFRTETEQLLGALQPGDDALQ